MTKKTIAILGAGFGGLRAAVLIAKKLVRLRLVEHYEIILIDRNEHHTYTPLLYEVATTSKETADLHELHSVATYNIRALIRGLPIKFKQAEVAAIDAVSGTVELKNGDEISHNYLIIALGSETNYYDIPGLKEHALPLKTITDAIRIRDAIWTRAMEHEKITNVVVGGGGPSGVELAGELKAWCGQLEQEFKGCIVNVKLIQAAPTILAGLDPRVITRAKRRLARLGVDVWENKKIAAVDAQSVMLQGGTKIPYDVFVWTGGVKAPDVLSRLPLKMQAQGKIEVIGRMECLPQTPDLKLHAKTYGLGDSICFSDPITKQPVPGVARAALSQATVVAYNVIEDIRAEQGLARTIAHRIYKPMNYPYITPVGGKYAIAKIGPFIVSGFFGWVLKGLVELNYLMSVMPPWKALVIWIKGFTIFVQNDRLG